MNALSLATALLSLSANAPQLSPSEVRDSLPVPGASQAEVHAAAKRSGVARLRAAIARQRLVQDEIDAVDQVQRAVDADPSLVLMPHEVVRLRAERSLLTSALESDADEALALRSRLGVDALDEAERSWTPRRTLDVRALSDAALNRAGPKAHERAMARVESEVSRIARAEHRLDDINQSVLPDVTEALTTALIDLPDGGAMLDVIEALERQAAVRAEVVDLQLERELSMIQLELLSGIRDPNRRSAPELTQVGSL